MSIRPHIIMLAALLLTSCVQEDTQEVGRVITIKLASDSTEITRADDGLNDKTSFVFPADFTVAVDGINFVYTANAFNSNMICSSPASYPVTGNSVRVQAFYPAFLMQYSTTPQTFTVAQDQSQTSMGTINYRVSDLMYGKPKSDFVHLVSGKVEPTDDPIPMVFEHQMVKIRIDVTTNGANVKRIIMKNVKRAIDFDTENITFSNLASASDGLGDNVIMYNDAIGTSTNFTCTALIPQQNLAVSTPFIDIVVDAKPSDVTMTYKLQAAANFQSGKQFIYNLSVNMNGVEVECSIANWDNTPAGWTNVNKTLTI